MVPFFNIATSGGTGTTWLVYLLNGHPDILCFHALREDPFTGDPSPIQPEIMATGLERLRQLAFKTRAWGLVHSFYGTEADDAIAALGGPSAGMIRHPIRRLHSLFVHHYAKVQGRPVRDNDIYATVTGNKGDLGRLDVEFNNFFPLGLSGLTDVEFTFFDTARVNLDADMVNGAARTEDEMMVFERVFAEPDYTVAHLKRLTGIDDGYFEREVPARLDAKENVHADKSAMPSDLNAAFDLWPEQFKRLYLMLCLRHGMDSVVRTYDRWGYDLGPTVVAYYEANRAIADDAFAAAQAFSAAVDDLSNAMFLPPPAEGVPAEVHDALLRHVTSVKAEARALRELNTMQADTIAHLRQRLANG